MVSKDTLLLFDVDGTLTAPRKEIDSDMRNFLYNEIKPRFSVGLVGGSDLNKISEQMGRDFKLTDFEYIFSENGLIAHKNGVEIGRESISEYIGEEKLQEFLNFCLHYMSEISLPVKRGTFIEYRTGMINISPVGRNCSQRERDNFEVYDFDHKIREKFVEAVKCKFPNLGLQYSIGGQISFDCFPKGWDKSYCLRYVENEFKEKIYFFGDKTFKGGNDYEIYNDSRVKGYTVRTPAETKSLLQKLFQLPV